MCQRKKAILQEEEDLFKQESINHRMVWIGRDFWRSSSPTPCQWDCTLHPAALQPCHAVETWRRCKCMQINHLAHGQAVGQYFLSGSPSGSLFCAFLCLTSVFNPFGASAYQSQPFLMSSSALHAAAIWSESTARTATPRHAQPPAARGAQWLFTAEESYFSKKFFLF